MNAPQKPGLINALALKYAMEPEKFYSTIQKTIMPPGATVEQTAALLMVAHQYDLNPILKQIYAFPSKGGGITPIISIDGWCELINRQPAFDGMEFEDHFDADGKVYAITCKMYRKDRGRATTITEYLDECQRATDPWRTSPKRMLRHRAMIQCARLSFGLSAAFDEGHQMLEEAPVDIDMEPIQRQVAPPKRTPPSPAKKPEMKPIVEDKIDPETGEIFDPEMFLTDLDAALVTAKNEQELYTVWADHDVSTVLYDAKDHFDRATSLLDWHKQRLAKAASQPGQTTA
jgi:phage recombination protein Bet